jgi:ubiquinone/menaquinone biosynthesis C-methylase UbiE
MAYTLYIPAHIESESPGQSWREEQVEQRIALCAAQTIEPYFMQYLPAAGKILEAGCGLGRWVFYLQRAGYTIAGVDYSSEAVEQIRKYDPHAPVMKGDVRALTYPECSFDAVISLGVMEHFEGGPDTVLRETYRVLKKDGYLFVSVPTENMVRKLYVHPLLKIKRRLKQIWGREYRFYEYRFGKKEFMEYVQNAGFEIITIVADELQPPRSIGLYTDFPLFHSGAQKWTLNRMGNNVRKILDTLSPFIACGGVMYIAKKV